MTETKIVEERFSDPRWRLSNLYMITDKKGHAVPFRPNGAQLKFLGDLHSQNIILKARQLGFTTLCCLIYLDACIFNPNTRAGVIAHRLDDAKVIFRDKIKFPYDHLDEGIKALVHTKQDSADTLTLANNSSIRVSTSMRSGTLQYLHISEFGKICAQFPEKAREIVTGALNAVEAGQFIVIESTAEGQEGAFYDMTQAAIEHGSAGRLLSPLDYKFHFFPWFQDPNYALAPGGIVVGQEYLRYFDHLEAKGIRLTDGQKAWYVKKDMTMGGDMKREYPSSPEEAFEQALEGAYFTREMDQAFKQGRIGGFPVDPVYPVNTFWDLGFNDLNTIWLHQYVKGFHRFVGYYENSGEWIGHYVAWLKTWSEERQVQFGEHYLPHDGRRNSIWLENGTEDVLNRLKFRANIVERSQSEIEQINQARPFFAKCQFDEAGCSEGLKRLRAFRKEWDEARGVWKDKSRHDINSHGAKAFMTFTASGFREDDVTVARRTRDRHRDKFYGSQSGKDTWMTA